MTVWHKGPPPSLGWWPASDRRNAFVLRWWNGKNWSTAVGAWRTAEAAGKAATTPTRGGEIEWRDRPDNWPERSKT